jgi:hypothetical protein
MMKGVVRYMDCNVTIQKGIFFFLLSPKFTMHMIIIYHKRVDTVSHMKTF